MGVAIATSGSGLMKGTRVPFSAGARGPGTASELARQPLSREPDSIKARQTNHLPCRNIAFPLLRLIEAVEGAFARTYTPRPQMILRRSSLRRGSCDWE